MEKDSIVRYTPDLTRPEVSFPAIVMGEWPSGELQLCVFQFENTALVRAAHPSQVTMRLDPEVMVNLQLRQDYLEGVLVTLKEQNEKMISMVEQLTREQETAKDSNEPYNPEHVDSTRRRKVS